MASPFDDPSVQQSLYETMAEPERQKYGFDARALYELLRRKAMGKMHAGNLNDAIERRGDMSFYGNTSDGRLNHQTSSLMVDPLNSDDMDSLYDLEGASQFKQSGMRGYGAQEMSPDPNYQFDMRGGYDVQLNPAASAMRDVFDYEPASPMAQHMARKQRPY